MTLALIGGLLAVPAYVLMAWDIISGRTKQNIAGWAVWSVLDGVTFFASIAGGNESPWLIGVFAVGSVVILILSLWRGDWKWELTETICTVGCAVAIFLWWWQGPTWSIACSVAAMFIGGLPMVWDTWHRPHEQVSTTWMVFFLACAVSLAAVPAWTITFALYPAVGVLYNGIMLVLSLRMKSQTEPDQMF
jgi:hypothetical protein